MNDRARAALSKACPPRPQPKPSGNPAGQRRDRPASTLARTSSLKRTAGPRPSRGHRSKGTPAEVGAWREAAFERVMAANDGYLVDEVTGLLLQASDVPQVHHPIEAADLFTMRQAFTLFEGHPLVLHPANSCVVAKATHDAHHASGPGRRPIPLAKLRPETWDLVVWLDEQAGNEWWSLRMRADYA